LKEFTTDKIRNICLTGQRGCGKTSLGDTVSFLVGANTRIGNVDDGSSLLDHLDAEMSRNTTLTSKLLACDWQGTKLNILDNPGHPDFIGELFGTLKVAESAIMLINAVAGVEVGTQIQWEAFNSQNISRCFFLNKMENENVIWKNNISGLKEAFGDAVAPVQIPIGESAGFKGIVDVIGKKAYTFDDKGKPVPTDIPADIKDAVESQREKLIELAAEGDDALMEKYFEEGTLSEEEFTRGFKLSIKSGKAFPVLCGSAKKNMGITLLLDFAARFLPAPSERKVEVVKTGTEEKSEIAYDASAKPLGYVFKIMSESHLGDLTFVKLITGTLKSGQDLVNQQTGNAERVTQMYTLQGKNRIELTSGIAGDIVLLVKLKGTHTGNTLAAADVKLTIPPTVYPNPVMDVAIKSKSKGDEDKIANGLAKLHEEDPTFKLIADPALAQQVLYGQGPTHIEVLTEKLKARYGVEVELCKPRIPYRETIKGKADTQYRHKKQSGGRGQFGEVHIKMEPTDRGAGFEFVDEIKGGVIPSKFIPAVEKGVVEAMTNGGLAGSQIVDVRVRLYYGKYHDVDSSDMAFKIAGSMAFKQAFMDAKPVLLEPIYNVEVTVPDEYTGDVMGDLSSRRGKVAGMDPSGKNQIIRATVPQSELYQYAVDLRSMTQGQGFYSVEFSHYEEVPFDAAQKIIAEAKAEREAEG